MPLTDPRLCPKLERALSADRLPGTTRATGWPESWLVEFAEDLRKVTVPALPFSAGAPGASSSGPLTVLELAGVPSLGVVHVVAPSGGIYLADPTAVTRYDRFFRHFRAAALRTGGSARLISDIRIGPMQR